VAAGELSEVSATFCVMGSVALGKWRTAGLSRLMELEGVHAHITGSPSAQQWGTRQLNQSLFLALMAQFQAYCRELHDEGVDVHVAHARPGQGDVLLEVLTQGRKLEVGNPRRSVLGADFGRLGMHLLDELKALGTATVQRLDCLDVLVEFRNAIGHGQESKIQILEASGLIQASKKSYDLHRQAIDDLAGDLDEVVSRKLATILQIARPW
jgi:hypothetical protein